MPRYTVMVVVRTSTESKIGLAVPVGSSVTVETFVQELRRRIVRQGIDTGNIDCVLHLETEDGPILDVEDALSEVVTEPSTEKIFAVFTQSSAHAGKASDSTASTGGERADIENPSTQMTSTGNELLHVRFITADGTHQDENLIQLVPLSKSASVGQLYEAAARHLNLPSSFEDADINTECNCTIARRVAESEHRASQLLVIHGKSNVESIEIPTASDREATAALRARFGEDLHTQKKVSFYGAELRSGSTAHYKHYPVVAICSKQRHIPVHRRADDIPPPEVSHRLLDLHTSEQPISTTAVGVTIDAAGLSALASDGVVDIFAVHRAASSVETPNIGKGSIFRFRPRWEPRVKQTDRGIAIFLSSLRVFASAVEGMEERQKDAVLHLLHLLTNFPPAVRAFFLLFQDKTITPAESAAIGHSVFHVLDRFIPTEVIGSDQSRLFEGTRLLLGYILEKSRNLKLANDSGNSAGPLKLPYLSAFDVLNLCDFSSTEPVMHVIQTTSGLIEKTLFDAFQENGVLSQSRSHFQLDVVQLDDEPAITRVALLAGGASQDITLFSMQRLMSDYLYKDAGKLQSAVDLGELMDLHHLAELCGRNGLAVRKPSQLTSAVAPCLTFDRGAHLSVYTGELPCSAPGKSSQIFRPYHGEETIDVTIVEQLIAPILQRYEADGTAVFDAIGGSVLRRLQAPDEILMFAVDTSASMRGRTDFSEINEDDSMINELSASSLIEPELYARTALDDMKEYIAGHESLEDMTAIIAGAPQQRAAATEVLQLLAVTLSIDALEKYKAILRIRERRRYYQPALPELEASLERIKTRLAGLTTHEIALCDFLIFRANLLPNVGAQWTWHPGEQVPDGAPSHHLPTLADDITSIPEGFSCPISANLLEDAVDAADGCTYSRHAIAKWFTIRKSSPLHGTELRSTRLIDNTETSAAVFNWIQGSDLTSGLGSNNSLKRDKLRILVSFASRVGMFQRQISGATTVKSLYQLAFRGLKGRYSALQLALGDDTLQVSNASASSKGISHHTVITIRLADETNMILSANASLVTSEEMRLVKVFENDFLFSYWVRRNTSQTLASIVWKFWRYKYEQNLRVALEEMIIWTDLEHNGDGYKSGRPRTTTEQLSTLLTGEHCFGSLRDEPVYKTSDVRFRGNSSNPLVLKVMIARKQATDDDIKLSRLDVLKQMFEALINRILAYGYKTHVGLVTFDSSATVAMPITHLIESFRRAVSNMQAKGDTCLWDGLALARDQLNEYGLKYPSAKKRVIVISDGADTKSVNNTSQDVCWNMKQYGIVVDSVSLGGEDNTDLRTISYMLGSYLFTPNSLVDSLTICEMEPFLSLAERPDITPPPRLPNSRLEYMARFWTSRRLATPTIVDETQFPPRKEHPNVRDSFVQLTAHAARVLSPSRSGSSSRSNLRISRLMTEIRQIATRGQHPKYDIYLSEADMSFWKVAMQGPDGSPYEDGTFMLYLHADEGYPAFAPKARFITRIRHPNVNTHGRICHSLFDRDWTSDTSMATVLDCIYGLLLQAEMSDPVNTSTTLGFHHDTVDFADEVREFTREHASKTREEIREELLNG